MLRHRVTCWVLAVAGAALTATPTVSARTTYLPCSTSKGVRYLVLQTRPTRCLTLSPRASLAEAADLVDVRWRHWGSATATAHATSLSFHLPVARTAVTITASGWEYDDQGRRYYGHLRLRSRYGVGNLWLAPGSVYSDFRGLFRDGVRDYLDDGAGGIVSVSSDTVCDFGAPAYWRCSTTAEAPDGCVYDMKGHFDDTYNLTVDAALPDASNSLDCGPPKDASGVSAGSS